MTTLSNRHAAFAMLVLSLSLLIYVGTADWTFIEMRDGTMIGAFPLAYVGLCLLFACIIGFGKNGPELLENARLPHLTGLFRIALFVAGGLLLAFFHENLGFVTLAMVFLAMNAWFMGQRRISALAIYCLLVCTLLFALFTSLGFELTVLPTGRFFGIDS